MKIFIIAARLLSLLLLSGCSAFSPTLDETGIVAFEIIQRESPPDISFVRAIRSSKKTVIRGQLKYPTWIWFKTFPGHMDITIEPLEGEKNTMHDVAIIRKRLPKKRGREAFFVARYGANVAKGTRVTVEYSNEIHEKPM